jgi:gluconolactonase
MLRLDESSGHVSVFREPSNNSNGNTVDNQGRLVTCEHLARRVTRTEIDGCHVYRIDPATLAVDRVVSDMARPNGLTLSPDESMLYIADTGATHVENGPRHICRFAVAADGRSLRGGEVFAEPAGGLFDGFRVDREGRIWTSTAEGVHCYDKDATLIGKVRIPEMVANVTFGGPKRNRLFICGTTSLYSIYLTTNGCSLG